MSVSSRSESVWQLLHQTQSVLTDAGFAEPTPPFPGAGRPGAVRPAEGYDDLVAKYEPRLAGGAAWPWGAGPATPLAVLLTQAPLTDTALAFVRSWFENSRVNLSLGEDFFVQPLPPFLEMAAYSAFAKDLCALLKPKALLSLGGVPAQRLLGAPLSLDSLRGTDFRFDRWSVVTTLDPEEFPALPEAEQKQFKAGVWRDLQRLLGKLRYG